MDIQISYLVLLKYHILDDLLSFNELKLKHVPYFVIASMSRAFYFKFEGKKTILNGFDILNIRLGNQISVVYNIHLVEI